MPAETKRRQSSWRGRSHSLTSTHIQKLQQRGRPVKETLGTAPADTQISVHDCQLSWKILERSRSRGGLLALVIIIVLVVYSTVQVVSLPNSSEELSSSTLQPRSIISVDSIAVPSTADPTTRPLSNRTLGHLSFLLNLQNSPPRKVRAPRAIDQAEWDSRIKTGAVMNCAFSMPIDLVQQSIWTTWSSMAAWGWNFVDLIHRFQNMYYLDEITHVPLCEDVGGLVDDNGYPFRLRDGWHTMDITHGAEFSAAPGPPALATGGQYLGMLNNRDRSNTIIIFMEMYSPAYSALPERTGPLPDLQRFSDVVALTYFHAMGGDVSGNGQVHAPRWFGIQFIAEGGIGMTNTLDIIRRALDEAHVELEEWPGVTFTEATTPDSFFTLLGSSHGGAVAYFLIQHKAWFGNMEIDQILIYADEELTHCHMAFSIVPAPATR